MADRVSRANTGVVIRPGSTGTTYHLAAGQEYELVTFMWSLEHGPCQECGRPAAFLEVDAYGPGRHMKQCSVCAANAAALGSTIRRIDPEG